MQEKKNLVLLSKVILINLFLIVLAGSIVRTTQSGMGCPDWPKCFGQWIPPTEIDQVLFKPNHEYRKKQFIIQNDSLFSAKEKFVSSATFSINDWEKYPKHDYAVFKTHHTWIEYINRLATVVLGLLLVLQLAKMFYRRYFAHNKISIILAIAVLLVSGFQAWLGKKVVDSNLSLNTISIHMMGIFVLLGMQAAIVQREKNTYNTIHDTKLKWITSLGILIVLVQILLGTQVREQIDAIAKLMNYQGRNFWINQLDFMFIIHRSMSWLVSLLVLASLYFSKPYTNIVPAKNILMFGLASTVLLGIVMAYLNIPSWSQPLHLLSASIIFYGFILMWLHVSFKKDK